MNARFLRKDYKIKSLLPNTHRFWQGVKFEGFFVFSEIHVFDLCLGMILKKGFNSFQAGFIFESHIWLYFFIDISDSILMRSNTLIGMEIKVFVFFCSFIDSVFFMFKTLNIDLGICFEFNRFFFSYLLIFNTLIIIDNKGVFKHINDKILNSFFIIQG